MAVTITAAQLAPRIVGNPDDHRELVEGVLAAATARVLRYAPAAPDEIHNEAVVRFAGYLAGSEFGGISETTVGQQSVTYTTNHAAAFRNSGAAGLLAPWRTHRAGNVEGPAPAPPPPISGGDYLRWG